MKKSIFPEGVKPIAPYSPGVLVGNLLFVSGQIALDAATGNLVTDNLEKETHQVLKNVKSVLETAGFSLEDVVKTTIFMKDMSFYATINEIYATYFSSGILPAREAVAVKTLPRDVNVEISVIAVKS